MKAASILLLSRNDSPFGAPPAQNSAEKALKSPVTMSFPHWSCCGEDFEHSKVPAVKGGSKGLGGVTPNLGAQVFLFSGMRVHSKEARRPAICSHHGCVTEEDLNSYVRFANKAASITTSRPGAIPAMPTLKEVEESL